MSRIWKRRLWAASVLAVAGSGGWSLYRGNPSWFRRKTAPETTHLACLSGVFRNGDQLFEGRFGLRAVFCRWEEAFPSDVLARIRDAGSIPLLTWEPYLTEDRDKDILPDIAAGRYDALIRRFAGAAAVHGGPILLRFAHEMNGDWYPWAGRPKIYVSAYRRVRDLFAAQGCANVRFVLGVNGEDAPRGRSNRFELYDPGSGYVDMVGVDFYNWGDVKPWSRWRSPRRIMTPTYERVIAAFPDKPMMLCEVGTASSGGDKAAWMADFFADLPRRFPAVKAFVWFDVKKECDWGFSQDPAAAAAFAAGVSARYFTDAPAALGWLWGEEPRDE